MTLNAAQLLAVSSTAALKVVIAGPGSGKTRTEVKAVKAVFSNESLESYQRQGRLPRVAVMTFTNGGANEFRQRLGDLAKSLSYCGTLHGYCYRLINRFGGFLGYIPGKVGILPDAERIPRLLACRDKLGVKLSQKTLLDRLASSWAECKVTTLVWKEYEFLLKRSNLVDYDLILQDGLALLNMREVRAQVGLDYLYVDEYQDSAQIDQLIYEMIPARNKFYCGDPDQSIFQFRNANPTGMLEAARRPDAEVHKLELNYRSDSDICVAANRLIAHNNERVEKVILPVSVEDGRMDVTACDDVSFELAMIARRIGERAWIGWQPRRSVAVLYRMNHDVKQCRDYLRSMGIPIQEPEGEQRPADWERAMLLLALLLAPENEILAERFLKLDRDAYLVDALILKCRASGESLSASIWKGINQGGVNIPVEWSQHWAVAFKILAQQGVTEGTVRLIQQRAELLAPDADLSDLLHDLHSNGETKAPDGASDGVVVSTIHAAKGREFDVVFLPAFEQGIIPSATALKLNGGNLPYGGSGQVDSPVGRAALEEERRLAFVGVTRAKHELYISHCAHRRGPWGPVGLGQPSQFIVEMGL